MRGGTRPWKALFKRQNKKWWTRILNFLEFRITYVVSISTLHYLKDSFQIIQYKLCSTVINTTKVLLKGQMLAKEIFQGTTFRRLVKFTACFTRNWPYLNDL